MEQTADRNEQAGYLRANGAGHPGETAGMGTARTPQPGPAMPGAQWYCGAQPGTPPQAAQVQDPRWYWYRQGMAAAYANQLAQAAGSAPPPPPHAAEAHHPKHDEHRYGQMMDMLGRFLNGEADMGDVVNGFFSLDFQNDQFWKGALVGAAATLLLTNENVQKGLAGSLGSIFGAAKSGIEKAAGAAKEAQKGEKSEKTAAKEEKK